MISVNKYLCPPQLCEKLSLYGLAVADTVFMWEEDEKKGWISKLRADVKLLESTEAPLYYMDKTVKKPKRIIPAFLLEELLVMCPPFSVLRKMDKTGTGLIFKFANECTPSTFEKFGQDISISAVIAVAQHIAGNLELKNYNATQMLKQLL